MRLYKIALLATASISIATSHYTLAQVDSSRTHVIIRLAGSPSFNYGINAGYFLNVSKKIALGTVLSLDSYFRKKNSDKVVKYERNFKMLAITADCRITVFKGKLTSVIGLFMGPELILNNQKFTTNTIESYTGTTWDNTQKVTQDLPFTNNYYPKRLGLITGIYGAAAGKINNDLMWTLEAGLKLRAYTVYNIKTRYALVDRSSYDWMNPVTKYEIIEIEPRIYRLTDIIIFYYISAGVIF